MAMSSREKAYKAHLLLEATQQAGWTNPEEIVEFVHRLERGLPAEDEFSVILNWLGQCKLVHKLDQFSYPPGAKQYRIPDLFAVFDPGDGPVPTLIEVKATETLSWRPDYLRALERYAELMRLPLLIAWKYQGLWVLFEPVHLQRKGKRLEISFLDAIKVSLLCLLAGDFSFSFRPGVEARINIRKDRETSEGFYGQVEDAYLLNADGIRHDGSGGILQLFSCIDQESEVRETATHAMQSFVIRSEVSEFAHRALDLLLRSFGGDEVVDDGDVDWRKVLCMERQLPLGTPAQAARNAYDAGFLRIWRFHPESRPTFIPNGKFGVTWKD